MSIAFSCRNMSYKVMALRNCVGYSTIQLCTITLRHEVLVTTMLAWLESLDHQLFFAVNHGLSSTVLDVLFQGLVPLGNGFMLVLLAGAGLWWRDRPVFTRHFAWLVLAVCLGALIVQGVKFGIGRPRPLSEFAALIRAGELHINIIGDALRARSFPSGHAQSAASVGMYLLWLYPRRWLWCSAGIVVAGFARIYAGVHFPLDVLAGTCIGVGSVAGVVAIQRQRQHTASLQC